MDQPAGSIWFSIASAICMAAFVAVDGLCRHTTGSYGGLPAAAAGGRGCAKVQRANRAMCMLHLGTASGFGPLCIASILE
jgi:hypothetical protein